MKYLKAIVKTTIIFGAILIFLAVILYLQKDFQYGKEFFAGYFFIYLLFVIYDVLREMGKVKALNLYLKEDSDLKMDGFLESDKLKLEIINNKEEKNRALIRKNEDENLRERKYLSYWIHEVKTPLFALKLLHDKDEDSRINILKIENLVEQIIYYSKIKGDFYDFEFKTVSLKDLIQKVLKDNATIFIESKKSIHTEIEDCEITTDPYYLSAAIFQILLNAVKYSESEINIKANEDEILISDDGMGIYPEDLERVFEYGYRGWNTKNKNSTGVGLALVKEILEKLGYNYELTSTVGKGTNFKISLVTKM